MIYVFPNNKKIVLDTLILDLNGTLTINGKIPHGVSSRILKLKKLGFSIVLFTGDTLGSAEKICKKMGIQYVLTKTGNDKVLHARKYNLKKVVTIGNGRIDLKLMKIVSLGIVTLQSEGVYTKTLLQADIIAPSILDALDMLINSKILIATLRE